MSEEDSFDGLSARGKGRDVGGGAVASPFRARKVLLRPARSHLKDIHTDASFNVDSAHHVRAEHAILFENPKSDPLKG
jgi:hypothetical protein